ncbi:MAG TPA: EF-hand domain-containing protein [Polyangiaceae bacterium]|nr:EF-hand domain-containing protein [Polyangiaceae bacterium]
MAAEEHRESHEGEAPRSDSAELRPPRTSDVVPKRPQPFSTPPPALGESELALLQECFVDLAGPDSHIDTADFKRSLEVKDAFLAQRVLAAFDRNRDGLVTRVEFLQGLPRLLFGNLRDKLRFAFRVHDLDGDGALDSAEITRMIELGLVEDGTAPRPVVVERFTSVLLRAADENGDGRLSFTEFEAVVARYPEVTEPLAFAEQSWLTQGRDLPGSEAVRPGPIARALRFMDNNVATVAIVALWLLANVVLFVHAWFTYQALGKNHAILLARGAGACLNLNGALIVLPMARRLLTWLRRTSFVRVLPVDASLGFHRLLGNTVFGLALVHSAAHLVNDSLAPPGVVASLFGSRWGATGLSLLIVLSVLWIFSLRRVRASGHFELFYWTHWLYPAWFALALVHGRVFWAWAAIPLVLFVVDRLWRLRQSESEARVLECTPLASSVTRLTLEKPADFTFGPGDYVFLRLPELARHEWHPFTISSAPERDVLTLHVRGLGNFTQALYRLAEERSRRSEPPLLTAYLDGPFGTASARIFSARRAVLIGAGIGVTPFASVLESIVLRRQAGVGSLEKVAFYWLNRDARSFEWFAELLADLERRDVDNLVSIHIFMTGGRGDSTAMVLNLARNLAHTLGDRDLFTGLRSMTRMGTPDWHAELAAAAGDDPEAVDVFFCGPPGLARSLARVASELDLRFHQEHF